ncbi:cytochrome C biogenesis protein ccsA, putative [Medicago truncatula]|uniref:Cytochrome C biogenesis protein ccsA, putative n=1 Tax=Medicago truncatula TaxID=3880 RepID=G7IWD5_MEDTR|nr:cytochrome C biogenesis protein ccsA, putative [Medicago truncatula]
MLQICFFLTGSETMKTGRRYEKEDRLSDLPDCILLYILSFLNTKQVIQTCILSIRCKNLPTCRWNNLWKRLSTLRLSGPLKSFKGPSKLVSGILSLRNDSTALYTLEFICDQEYNWWIRNAQVLCISSFTLVNLTIYCYSYYLSYKLSALSICNFAFTGSPNRKLYGSHLSCVKHLYINTNMVSSGRTEKDSLVLLNWLLEFANITSLTISYSTLQVLSLVPNLFKVKLTTLCNVESLAVKRDGHLLYMALVGQRTSILDGVLDFLLQNSPSAKLVVPGLLE